MWNYVIRRFSSFLSNIALTPEQEQDGKTKAESVHDCLRAHYYGDPRLSVGMYVGSWLKNTKIRPPRDVDIYFYLPKSVYARFAQRTDNRQSAILQEVKGVLENTFRRTDMRGDGQVVMVNFDSYAVEVAPVFELESGQFWICDTHDGGSYKPSDPNAELQELDRVDAGANRNLRPLVRMLKTWQSECDVPLKSFMLELLASEFLRSWPHRLHGLFYYDWMVRDFLQFLSQRAGTFVFIPGTYEPIQIGDVWVAKAQRAFRHAANAEEHEHDDHDVLAGLEWQYIFGSEIPLMVL
jgi:hypothetical protein